MKAPPIEGRANAALVEILAETFGVAKSKVELVIGGVSRSKVFLIRGIDNVEAVRIFALHVSGF